MTAPLQDRADDATVDALLSDLSFLRAEGFMDAPPPDPEIGLDRPVFEAKLSTPAEGESPPRVFHVLVGDEVGANQRVARGSEAASFRIPAERLGDLPRSVAAYRFKELARFVASDARQLEVAFHDPKAGAHVVIAEHGEDGWASAPENFASGRAARIVAELARLDATDIVADGMSAADQGAVGLDPPRVLFRVRGAADGDAPGPVLAEVLLGEADPDRGIVARSRPSERVYRIDFELAEHLPLSREAFLNRFVAEEAAEAAEVPETDLPSLGAFDREGF